MRWLTDQDMVRKLNAVLNRILQSSSVRERLSALGVGGTGATPGQFAETMGADTLRWARALRDLRIRIE